MDDKQLLELRFDSDAGDGLTVREYMRALLVTLWKEGEGFRGKRPFGNSGWEYDLYKPLIQAGAMPGEVDEDGYIVDCDEKAGHALVLRLIGKAMGDVE